MLITNVDFKVDDDSDIPKELRFLFGGKYTDIDP